MNITTHRLRKRFTPLILGTILPFLALQPTFAQSNTAAWSPKKAAIMTPWASKVNPKNPLPDYPRPQLMRKDWLNLNGIWQYQPGKEGDPIPTGKTLTSSILVPYPVESALSGVMERHDRLWYRRTFTVPSKWKGKQLMLNFGAVDYESEVFVNGKSVGTHQGGYLPFSFDISPYLSGDGPQEIVVRVFDPTDLGGQPRGKQTLYPGGIMYTPTTGIWQTVWIEPVANVAVQKVHMVPDIDAGVVKMTVNTTAGGADTRAVVTVKEGGKVVNTTTVTPNAETRIPVPNAHLWSPDDPFLYDVEIKLYDGKNETDRVTSYFGMRKISVGRDGGVPKLLLNNKFTFQIGPLDQGFWPDGIYTPPTEDAVKSEIKAMKTLGFNMVRKHIKVEPARWYYWTDKMGLLVWQDMPSPNSYTDKPQPLDKAAFETQLTDMVQTLWNVPSIIMWVVFNEGQGQHDTPQRVALVKNLDPSRVVNEASGWDRTGAGDVSDVHSYPPPNVPPPSRTQALACGEYGGIGLFVKGHTWINQGGGYVTLNSGKDVEELYGEFSALLKSFRDEKGLSAAVYTQITDVETELNGLYTYDRILKVNAKEIAKANRFEYSVPTYTEVVPTSEKTAQTWKYTFSSPTSTEWNQKNYDDRAWQSGPGGFGTSGTPGAIVRTTWNTPDVWLRRTFNPGALTADQIKNLVVRNHHDEDVEIYINGVLAYRAGGYTGSYEYKSLTEEGKKAIYPNQENTIAIHCRQTQGGQYIDAGLSVRIPAKK